MEDEPEINHSHFNSIKVRLERTIELFKTACNRYFNSIKVRLEPNFSSSFSSHDPYFNSIKVRLEPKSIIQAAKTMLYFNSIKVRLEQQISSIFLLLLVFQFHKGTIRTTICSWQWWNFRHFNSIKVRLEPTRHDGTRRSTSISIP